jgi:hypothetical protein
MTNTKPRDLYKEIFKILEVMTLYSQYIFSLLLYIISNKYDFNFNNEIHKYMDGCLICEMIVSLALYGSDLFQHWLEHCLMIDTFYIHGL